MTLTDYINKMKRLVKDESSILSDQDFILSLENALIRLSKDYPLIVDSIYNGNEGCDYDLPDNWVDGFSFIQAIEYPYGIQTPAYLEEDDFIIYQGNNSKKVRFLKIKIDSNESYKIFYALPYKISDSGNNVPDFLSNAVINLSAHYACLLLSGKFAQFQNTAINTEIIKYDSLPEKFEKLALKYFGIYENLLFDKIIDENGNLDPSAAIVTQSFKYLTRENSIFHM